MSYKFLKENDDHYEMQHPNGEKFIIAKKGLNEKVVSHIQGLYKGGEVSALGDEPNASVMPPVNQDPTAGLEQYPQAVPTPMPGPAVMDQTPQQLVQNSPQVEQPLPPPQAQDMPIQQQPMQPSGPSFEGGYNQISSGLGMQAKAQEQLGKEQAGTYEKLQSDLVAADKLHKDNQASILKDIEKTQQAASMDTDPNRYWGSLSTGNKISASIGLILGGIGAGLAHGENQALKVINNAIENDIQLQKVDQSKNMNLYKANLDKYKDADMAHNATRLQLMSVADLKLKQAEQVAKSQEAKASLQMARGELQMKAAPLIDSMAQQKTMKQVMTMAQLNPEAISPAMAQMLPKDERDRFVPGAGFALTPEGAKKIKEEYKPDHDDAITAIDKMVNLRKKYGSEIMNREAVAEADTLKGVLKGKLRTFLVGPGAVSESEQKILDSIIQDPTSLTSGDASVYKRLSSLKEAINNSYVNKAKLQGLDMSKQAQSMSQPEVKTMNGIPYQKVNGGWAPLKTGK